MSVLKESASTTASPPLSESAGTAPGRSRSTTSAQTRLAIEEKPGSATLADPSVDTTKAWAKIWKLLAEDAEAKLRAEKELRKQLVQRCRQSNRRLRCLERALLARERWIQLSDGHPRPGTLVAARDQLGGMWLAVWDGEEWECAEQGGFTGGTELREWFPLAGYYPDENANSGRQSVDKKE